MKLTREETIRKFRDMWNWIAEQTVAEKRVVAKDEYFIVHNVKESVSYNCYLCEYTHGFDGSVDSSDGFYHHCHYCPVEWVSERSEYMCIDDKDGNNKGLYSKWQDCVDIDDWEEAARLARKIASLPERKENS